MHRQPASAVIFTLLTIIAISSGARADGLSAVKSCEADNERPDDTARLTILPNGESRGSDSAAALIKMAREKAKEGKDTEAIQWAALCNFFDATEQAAIKKDSAQVLQYLKQQPSIRTPSKESPMKSSAAVALIIFFFGVGSVPAQDAASRSTSAGVFTADQAKNGASAYDANCATCHGAELRSTDREIPNLSDKSFKFSWVGKTIGETFELVRDTMPPKEEHSLGDQVYLDIVTYILQFNKAPAGNQPLKPDLQILKQITIAAPPG
jgi:mono/diheme cytochrome c family protein